MFKSLFEELSETQVDSIVDTAHNRGLSILQQQQQQQVARSYPRPPPLAIRTTPHAVVVDRVAFTYHSLASEAVRQRQLSLRVESCIICHDCRAGIAP
ncbi:hypothetical protein GUJ93_ZPchr0002g25328 [Zizania palustris]|uniref:Uncharacterized protein n=1 Tax=Zizania palustris TaxID=103762 RepID=A0A8J5S2R7_ZIZPA|nr:hypothetical protein GUJ93_ZPchr0002g25328 [Zizania palustris]